MSALINYVGHIWAAFFGPLIIQNSLFLGCIFLLLYIYRNASAQFKYNISLIGLLKLLIPSFIPFTYFSFSSSAGKILPINISPSDSADTLLVDKQLISTADASLDLYGILLIVWISVIIIYLLYTLLSTGRIALLLRNSVPIDTGELDLLQIPGKIGVFKSDRISMPITFGFIPKKIYVPVSWDDWTNECKRLVIQHELAHIKRKDNLVQVVQILTQAIYFFNPLVLLLNRQLKEFREMVCDDVSVVLTNQSRIKFSKYLVEIAETAVKNPIACESVMALVRHRNSLFKRITYQLKESTMLHVSKEKKWAIIISLLLLIVPFSLYLTAKEPAFTAESSSEVKFSIEIKANDEIIINDNPGSMEELLKMLSRISEADKQSIFVTIKAENDVIMNRLEKIQQILMISDIFKIGFVKPDGEKLSLMLPPPENELKLKQISEKNKVTIFITSGSDILVNNSKSKSTKVKDIVNKHLSENQHKIFIVQWESKSRYESFLSVLDQVKEAGAQRIVIGENKAQ